MAARSKEYYRIAVWACVVVAIYAVALRLYLAWDLPLWIDESWTAVLSSAPTFGSFARQMWLDSNAPLYYLLIWIWPFESNLGLRFPSFVFMIAAAAVAGFWRPAGLQRETAWFWAFLLLLWQPGITLFLDARYYGLLFFISTAQTIAYIKLLDEPNRRRALVWTGLTTLGVLTHYFAAIPAAVQGLYYLWRHRTAALKTWPAVFVTLPAFGWGLYHLPRLQLYAQPGISWYERLSLPEVPGQLFWLVGGQLAGIGLLVLVALFWAGRSLKANLLAAVLTTAASGIMVIVAGMLWPIFTFRYLIPVVPAVLLGVASSARPAGYPLIAFWLVLSLGNISHVSKQLKERANFGLEEPAKALAGAKTVTWMMDYGGSKIHDRAQMEAMLADAFARNGQLVEARWDGDLLGGDGLIWFYKREKAHVAKAIREKWSCQDIPSGERLGMVCSRPDSSSRMPTIDS